MDEQEKREEKEIVGRIDRTAVEPIAPREDAPYYEQ